MTVEAIRLTNFMAFKETGWIELCPITLLFGRNSSGKSAIIRALLLLKQSLNTVDIDSPLLLKSRYGVEFGSFRDMVHGGIEGEIVRFHFRCRNAEILDTLMRYKVMKPNADIAHGGSLDIALGYAAHRQVDGNSYDSKRVEFSDLQIREIEEGAEDGPLLLQAGLLDPEDAQQLGDYWFVDGLLTRRTFARSWAGFGCRSGAGFLPILVPPSKSSVGYRCLEELMQILKQEVTGFLSSIVHLGPIRPEPQRRYSFDSAAENEWREHGWGAFLDFIGGRLSQIGGDVNQWLQRLELGKSAEPHPASEIGALVTEYEIGITETDESRPLPLSAIGFGASQVLPVITQILAAPMQSITIIEQPELHLHPEAQATLADFLIKYTIDRH